MTRGMTFILPPPEEFQKPRRVADSKESMNGLWVEGKIVEKTNSALVQTRYGDAMFCTAVLQDNTGKIRLNLYRDQTNVKVGDMVRIENGFTNSYGELNVGKKGRVVTVPGSNDRSP